MQAERAGDHQLATAIRQVAAEPTAAGKQALADAYIQGVKGGSRAAVLQRARATQFLSGLVMKGVRD